MNKKKWIVIGGAASAFALAPLAAAAGPSLFDQPMSGSGVVVAAATAGPSAEPGDPTATASAGRHQHRHPGQPADPRRDGDADEPGHPADQGEPAQPRHPEQPGLRQVTGLTEDGELARFAAFPADPELR